MEREIRDMFTFFAFFRTWSQLGSSTVVSYHTFSHMGYANTCVVVAPFFKSVIALIAPYQGTCIWLSMQREWTFFRNSTITLHVT